MEPKRASWRKLVHSFIYARMVRCRHRTPRSWRLRVLCACACRQESAVSAAYTTKKNPLRHLAPEELAAFGPDLLPVLSKGFVIEEQALSNMFVFPIPVSARSSWFHRRAIRWRAACSAGMFFAGPSRSRLQHQSPRNCNASGGKRAAAPHLQGFSERRRGMPSLPVCLRAIRWLWRSR